MRKTPEHMLIVGAGQAGTRAAIELRSCGWRGAVTLVDSDPYGPYERPPLTKEFLTAGKTLESLTITPLAKLAALNIQLKSETNVIAVTPSRRVVKLSDGTILEYTKLLLATGRNPRRLMLPGLTNAQVMYVRTASDAAAVRQHLARKERVLVVGSGFIGLEVAAAARQAGCNVTVVEAASRALGRNVPSWLARTIVNSHRKREVTFYFDSGISTTRLTPVGILVQLISGQSLMVDCIVVGIGATPAVDLAESAGLIVDNGIVVDQYLQTNDEHIFAAGDVCAFPNGDNDQLTRLECWDNANNQGVTAAHNILGCQERFLSVPWFWTDQYDLQVRMAGSLASDRHHEVITRTAKDHRVCLYLHDQQITGAAGIGTARITGEMRIAQRLISAGTPIRPDILSDSTISLKKLLPRAT